MPGIKLAGAQTRSQARNKSSFSEEKRLEVEVQRIYSRLNSKPSSKMTLSFNKQTSQEVSLPQSKNSSQEILQPSTLDQEK